MTHRQYALSFVDELRVPSTGEYHVSGCNALAHQFVVGWKSAFRTGQGQGLTITGPKSCGKTFLGRQISALPEAVVIRGSEIFQMDPATLADAQILVLDDAEKINDPAKLTRLIDVVFERGHSLVLIGAGNPSEWAQNEGGMLIDLQTRLAAMPEAKLGPPDVELLMLVLEDWLIDRQILLKDAGLVELGVSKLKRSFASLTKFTNRLDEEALHAQKTIDKALVQSVLAQLPEHTLL